MVFGRNITRMLSSLICTALVCVGCAGATYTTLSTTGYDATFTRFCGTNSIFYRVRSWHDNRREDRQWTYYCKSGYPITSSKWSDYVNGWDAKMEFKCGTNSVVTGMYSEHNNGKEDRRWKVRCSTLDSALRLVSCGTSGWVNGWDGRMDYSVSSTRVIKGFNSYHNNGKEDRLWRVNYCSVCTTKRVYRAWTIWGPCTKLCTGSDGVSGVQSRSRTCYSGHSDISFCSGYSCSATQKQTQRCGTQRCRINGRFSNWSHFGACSKSCGFGSKTRTRKCNNPAPAYGGANCIGFAYQTLLCKLRECKVNGQYGAWSAYSTCSASCGTGLKTRTRRCNNPAPANGGAFCAGNNLEAALCQIKACPKPTPVNGQYGAWTNFTACSASCGNGIKTRTRRCDKPAPSNGGACCSGVSVETVLCQLKPCPTVKDAECKNIGGTCRKECTSNEKKTKHARKKCTDRGYLCCLVQSTAKTGTIEA